MSGRDFPTILRFSLPPPAWRIRRVRGTGPSSLLGDTADFLAAGATLLRGRDDDTGWDVLADPEGDELCLDRDLDRELDRPRGAGAPRRASRWRRPLPR
jgi:hypothetical protein